ncbi:unnamed protein product [Cylicostephanus goldi]|uniref:Uncharacterized protein n=1 Tax=Cylicostephanus goldi TaxID=71465 RepID=A0A3P6UX73_CYLGO|nr:unnamed protein product [Cylicostephanus goldi]
MQKPPNLRNSKMVNMLEPKRKVQRQRSPRMKRQQRTRMKKTRVNFVLTVVMVLIWSTISGHRHCRKSRCESRSKLVSL